MSTYIDLNCDMGEGYHTDELIMPYISSANIACGYHAGDESTINKTIELALQYGVAIGAHPSYPDREGFGRRNIEMDISELSEILVLQIELIRSIATSAGTSLNHVKPHGALYNTAADNYTIASTVVKAIKSIDPALKIYGMPNSELEKAARKEGIRFCTEMFCDRTYTEEGRLTPRTHNNALINSTQDAVSCALQAIKEKTITRTSGKLINIAPNTLCIHGDGPHALEFAKTIRIALEKEHIIIAACK